VKKMQRRAQKLAFVLALAAIALVGFSTTADLLPHHHDNISERVCPLCHPPIIGLQPEALKLPAQGRHSWPIDIYAYYFVPTSSIFFASPRAPPSA
jgi:hypothetical protein